MQLKIHISPYLDLFQGYLKCSFDGNCEMDIFNRRICPSCRLDKCFALGMQTANVRPSVTIKKITPDKITVLTRLNKKYELQRVKVFIYQFL
jgi:hypothetical protein